jgi:apolipoprotein N-acyltransferase
LIKTESWLTGKSQALAAFFSGIMLAGAFSPWDFWPLALVSLTPLLGLSYLLPPKKALAAGLLFGMGQGLAQMYWLNVVITQYGGLPWLASLLLFGLMALYLALYPAVFAFVASRFVKRGLPLLFVAPLVWAGLEWVRAHILTGFPWLPLANSLAFCPKLLQTAEWWGTGGLSAGIVLINALVMKGFFAFREKRRICLSGLAWVLTGVIIVACAWGFGERRIKYIQGLAQQSPQLLVSVVQGNQSIADIQNPGKKLSVVEKHLALTRKESEKQKKRPWLVVWSESAGPFYMLSEARPSIKVLKGAGELGAYLTLGTMGSVEKDGKYLPTNRSFLVDPLGRPHGWYDKVHLVPFGEYVPLGDFLFFVRAIAALGRDFAPGEKGTTLKAGPAVLGPLICYESIFSELALSQRRRGANLIINQTNDAWFGRTGASRQHLSHLVLRSVENRMSCARSANTGISGFILPDGTVHQLTGLFTEAVKTKQLPLLQINTFFTGHGDIFSKAALGISILLLLLTLWPGFGHKGGLR